MNNYPAIQGQGDSSIKEKAERSVEEGDEGKSQRRSLIFKICPDILGLPVNKMDHLTSHLNAEKY